MNQLKKITLAAFTFIGCMIATTNVNACTGIKLIAKDNSFVHGRTLEFGMTVETSATFIPRGYEFTGTTPKGPGLKYKSKYAVIGAIAFNEPAIMDGLNEKGLAAGIFYFPGFAGYTEVNAENQSKGVSPVEFANWILTQFETVDEVKAALSSIVITPTVSKNWGNIVPPFHYIIYDRSGKSLVIEPTLGKLVTFDNPFGVFTNSPSFDWHMTNLRNYINLTPNNVKPLDLRGVSLASFGQGSGMVGMPGDFTPPSRFVRAAIFSLTAIPVPNVEESIYQGFHILNNFDIPVGVARDKVGDITYSDYTMITCMRDPQALKYYFKTYDDQTIKMIDLKKFALDSKEIKSISSNGKQVAVDISADLK